MRNKIYEKIKEKLSTIIYKLSIDKGFTLIELLVVFSVASILGGVAIAGFSNYNNSQMLAQSTNEVVSMLQTAKSRAQSQYKPAGCTATNALLHYKVDVSASTYTLTAICHNPANPVAPITVNLNSKTLPTGITFNASRTVRFLPLLGGAHTSPAGNILLNKGSSSKTITVSAQGNITIQ